MTAFLLFRARRKRFPFQYFRDAHRRGASLIPVAAFLLVLPVPLLLLFDWGLDLGALGPQPAWAQENESALFAGWAAEYPLTLVFYHALHARMQKDGFYDSPPVSALRGIALDLLKHGILFALALASLIALGQTVKKEKMTEIKAILEKSVKDFSVST